MDLGERREEGETYGESNMEASITMSKIDSNGNLLYDSENSHRDSVLI